MRQCTQRRNNQGATRSQQDTQSIQASRANPVNVTSIEESRDIDALKVENLVGSLQTFIVNFR